MAKDTITLALNGDINIHQFSIAISNLESLVREITKDIAADKNVQWIIHDLQAGSAVATVRGESDIVSDVERIVDAYTNVGKALEQGKRPDYSESVVKAARGIVGILDKQVTSVRFETAVADTVVYRQPKSEMYQPSTTKANGAIEGRVQTLTSRKGLRFTLYDTLYDRAVSCYLEEDQDDMMREVWGRRVIIEGEVSRDSLSNRPIAIRYISNIRQLSEVNQGNYLKARGISPMKDKSEMPEIVIRGLRDA